MYINKPLHESSCVLVDVLLKVFSPTSTTSSDPASMTAGLQSSRYTIRRILSPFPPPNPLHHDAFLRNPSFLTDIVGRSWFRLVLQHLAALLSSVCWRHVESSSCLSILLPQDFLRSAPNFQGRLGVLLLFYLNSSIVESSRGLKIVHLPSRWGMIFLLFTTSEANPGRHSVPKFFRWLSERYPAISQLIAENRIPEFDCLYVRRS